MFLYVDYFCKNNFSDSLTYFRVVLCIFRTYKLYAFQMAHKEDEEPYVLNLDVMEDDFYDGMYSFLEDRGITEEFCEELVTICTDLEANNYRQLLVDMKSFVE